MIGKCQHTPVTVNIHCHAVIRLNIYIGFCLVSVNHEVKCKVCKLPVKGLRYFCLKCVNYNQCQNCFLIGATNKKHKLKHAMQEYCWLVSIILQIFFITCQYLKVI
jgi:hypothetical protein|uniref:Dystrophin, isoform E n=1 Tax=Sipha flava TaxID=143950 RepID=A0A2S2Q6T0_9HEMI